MGLYALVWLVLIGYECAISWINFKNKPRAQLEILYSYPRPGGVLVWNIFTAAGGKLDENNPVTKIAEIGIVIVAVFIPFGLPSLISLVSAVAQVWQIFRRSRTVCKAREKAQKRNTRMSETIILLTSVFFICNTGYLAVTILNNLKVINYNKNYNDYIFLLLASNHLLYLNSFLTPLILILRGSSMMEFVRGRVGLESVRQRKSNANNQRSSDLSQFKTNGVTHV